MTDRKPIAFRGSALADLRAFPDPARREAGYQLDRVQQGLNPDHWRAMGSVGRGVREIRIQDADGAFRIFFVVKFADAVHVLHCFQKKMQKTSQADIETGRRRYRELVEELNR